MKKIFLGLLVFSTAAMVGCSSTEAKKTETKTQSLVKISPAITAEVDQIAEYTASIIPFVQNNISPSQGLRIEKIHVDVGDNVRKGQLLVEMDKRQYLQAVDQMTNTETDYLRLKKLYEEGGVSKQQLDQLETQLKVSKHSVENLLENVDLVSPITGVVTERLFDPGDMYSPGTGKILTVMQLDKVKILVNVSEQFFPLVNVGMPVDIKADVYPDEIFAGRVSLIYPALDPTTRTFTAEITIPNPSTKLRPGMFSRVILNLGKTERVMVPDVAVQKQIGSNERYVFVIKDTIADRRPVTLGRVVDGNYEILSGVQTGEQVVIAGATKLMDQSVVTVTK